MINYIASGFSTKTARLGGIFWKRTLCSALRTFIRNTTCAKEKKEKSDGAPYI